MARAVYDSQKAVKGPYHPLTLAKSLKDGFDSDVVEAVMGYGGHDPARKPQIAVFSFVRCRTLRQSNPLE
jgi:hypothetical protein